MKRKLTLLIMLCIVLISLVGCGKDYEESTKIQDDRSFGSGHFTTIKEWGTPLNIYQIVYANDTNVMYFVVRNEYMSGITPLYNSDGTLQIYDGE